mmetsp:Transcript_29689/g.64831  ORF Transcript_29689/g.64831 Transcript_29689/m.64831 type:complete len:217 (-) Transcript_29689:1029-1679(-)|eukprot:CAMPEP_0118923324 /NCGR_PEP_ID=MMETSP1169-20130426/1894_1 /TAXON_ID=36882 /ORGANISM="Pyramimonas obovata, Strain CCMP722" /LENGTH=216 /DNA_ID=CAMNT_0006864295 /DNA_START=15 /DNA_END=665 /DNA_ORIENTATION=-
MTVNTRFQFVVGICSLVAVTGVHDTDPFVGVSLKDRRSTISAGEQLIILSVPQGNIRIKLRPDLSKSSVEQVLSVAKQNACASGCKFYRAEPDFLLQGSIRSRVPSNTELGSCPPEFRDKPRSTPCPAHDPNCGCHGPIMIPGMVGWAGGGAGPDFFIYTGHGPATHWNNDHTVWGEIADELSFEVVDNVLKLPTNRPGHGMAMLVNTVRFELKVA